MSTQSDRQSLIEQTMTKAIKNTNEPIKISWTNLSYTVQVACTKEERSQGKPKTKPFEVLRNVTGYALPGQTLYIMGASGAGKTSLMNALSDRINL